MTNRYVKEIKTEVFNTDKLLEDASRVETLAGTKPRLVMNPHTRDLLKAKVFSLCAHYPNTSFRPFSERFHGCFIDLNEGMPDGEVLFTTSIDV